VWPGAAVAQAGLALGGKPVSPLVPVGGLVPSAAATTEAFFATLECELLDRRSFRSQAEARMALFAFIEGFYDPTRRHSALGYLSPIEYEASAMAENN
jgi:hypothetical protein